MTQIQARPAMRRQTLVAGTIDQTLARGLTNRLRREVREGFDGFLTHEKLTAYMAARGLKPSSWKSASKAYVAMCRNSFGDLVISDFKEKTDAGVYAFLPEFADGQIMPMAILAITKRQGGRAIRGFLPHGVTRHCLERFFERAPVTSLGDAAKVVGNMLLSTDAIEHGRGPEGTNSEVAHEFGTLHCRVIDDSLVAVTFIGKPEAIQDGMDTNEQARLVAILEECEA
jgi:hypothetical protein